jgi:hypothetical protein
MICTWKDCTDEGTESQKDKNGKEWALLCKAHAEELDEAIGSMEAKKLLRAWARAHHKHPSRQELVKVCADGATAIAKFAQALRKK